MTTIQVPYTCGKCKSNFEITMKAGEPIISRSCPRCGSIADPPTL